MADVEIVPAQVEHAEYIADHARVDDVNEIWASSLMTPMDAMLMGMSRSDKVLTGLHHGKPVCMWGIALESYIGMIGVPWMVGADHLDNGSAVPFLRRSRPMLVDLAAGYDMLQNYVDARNLRSIQWLKYMGFILAEAEPYGALKLPFHKFTMENG